MDQRTKVGVGLTLFIVALLVIAGMLGAWAIITVSANAIAGAAHVGEALGAKNEGKRSVVLVSRS